MRHWSRLVRGYSAPALELIHDDPIHDEEFGAAQSVDHPHTRQAVRKATAHTMGEATVSETGEASLAPAELSDPVVAEGVHRRPPDLPAGPGAPGDDSRNRPEHLATAMLDRDR
jgi:hypothetical protein